MLEEKYFCLFTWRGGGEVNLITASGRVLSLFLIYHNKFICSNIDNVIHNKHVLLNVFLLFRI